MFSSLFLYGSKFSGEVASNTALPRTVACFKNLDGKFGSQLLSKSLYSNSFNPDRGALE
jgi:hypothetical protein